MSSLKKFIISILILLSLIIISVVACTFLEKYKDEDKAIKGCINDMVMNKCIPRMKKCKERRSVKICEERFNKCKKQAEEECRRH